MRCPDCEKFTSLEMADPEVEEVRDTGDGTAEADVRIVRQCSECSTDMKEATLTLAYEFMDDWANHMETKHKGVDDTPEMDLDYGEPSTFEEGGGRYAKSYFGVEMDLKVSCPLCKEELGTYGASDKIAASGMDELV